VLAPRPAAASASSAAGGDERLGGLEVVGWARSRSRLTDGYSAAFMDVAAVALVGALLAAALLRFPKSSAVERDELETPQPIAA
jgi:hypothetical protein